MQPAIIRISRSWLLKIILEFKSYFFLNLILVHEKHFSVWPATYEDFRMFDCFLQFIRNSKQSLYKSKCDKMFISLNLFYCSIQKNTKIIHIVSIIYSHLKIENKIKQHKQHIRQSVSLPYIFRHKSISIIN